MTSYCSSNDHNNESVDVTGLASLHDHLPQPTPMIQALRSLHAASDTKQPLRSLESNFASMTSLKSNHNLRLAALLSKLSKLIMLTPYKPLETFTLFPKLPIEIRLKISRHLCTQPHKLKLFFDRISNTCDKPRLIHGQSKHPAVLEVNRESRAEGLRFYILCHDILNDGVFTTTINYVYIKFALDRFSFFYAYPANFGSHINLGPEILNRIKYVDIGSFGTLEEGDVCFDELAVASLLVRTKSLVEIRAVMTREGVDNLLDSASRADDLDSSLMCHSHMKSALDHVIHNAGSIITRTQRILNTNQQNITIIPPIHAKFSAVSSPGMASRPI